MNVGSLFSGVGGLDLGLERAGMTVIWQSEIDPYASRVLAKHWPTVPNLGDVTTIDWSTVERPDLICGGYPCQPFSLAGIRAGADDPRHLWPHFARAIRDLRPRYALLENVPGHLSMGFDRVLGDLAEIGYDTEWCSIPAAAVGAPHLRWRIFCVATDTHADEFGCGRQQESDVGPSARIETSRRGDAQRLRHDVPDTGSARRRQDGRSPLSDEGPHEGRTAQDHHVTGGDGAVGDVADSEVVTVGSGLRTHESRGQRRGRSGDSGGAVDVADTDDTRSQGRDQPRQRPGERDARPSGWTRPDHWLVEPSVGRVAHGVPNRVDRLRCLGNAVVPQVAEWVGRRIVEAAL